MNPFNPSEMGPVLSGCFLLPYHRSSGFSPFRSNLDHSWNQGQKKSQHLDYWPCVRDLNWAQEADLSPEFSLCFQTKPNKPGWSGGGGGEGAVPSRDGGRGGGGRGGEEGDARRRGGPAATGAEEVRSWARRRRPGLAGAGADAQAQGSRLLRARHRSSRGTGGPDSSGGAGWRRLAGLAAGSVEPSDPRVFKGIL